MQRQDVSGFSRTMVKLQPEEHHFSHGKKHPKSIKVGNFNLLQISNKYISPEQIYYLNHIMRKLVLRNSSDQPVYHVILILTTVSELCILSERHANLCLCCSEIQMMCQS